MSHAHHGLSKSFVQRLPIQSTQHQAYNEQTVRDVSQSKFFQHDGFFHIAEMIWSNVSSKEKNKHWQYKGFDWYCKIKLFSLVFFHKNAILSLSRTSFWFTYAGMVTIDRTYTTTHVSPGINTKDYIVIHHTWTGRGSLDSVIKRFETWPVSCHYVIDEHGTIVQFNTDDAILWHAGISTRDGKKGLNRFSIGIELIGPLPWFTNSQRRSLRDLVVFLLRRYNLDATRLIRHKDISPGRKNDVDDSLWNRQYQSRRHYQYSYRDLITAIHMYERLFRDQFPQSSLSDSILHALPRLYKEDGTINLAELMYFYAIHLERLASNPLFLWPRPMSFYQKLYEQENATKIKNGTTIFRDIDTAIRRCTNADGTINLKELMYFFAIGIERVRDWRTS